MCHSMHGGRLTPAQLTTTLTKACETPMDLLWPVIGTFRSGRMRTVWSLTKEGAKEDQIAIQQEALPDNSSATFKQFNWFSQSKTLYRKSYTTDKNFSFFLQLFSVYLYIKMFIVEFYFRKWLVSLVLTIIRELVPDTQTFLFMFFLSFSVNARTTIPSR